MKYGLALPYNTTKLVAEVAHLAEENGWDGCFLGDAIWCEDPMIALAAAAMTTSRIQLGTLVIPVPLRSPWKIASESIALDQLSNGRVILGLGTGAVWMGWQGFPDEVTNAKARAEMLDETIDILSRMYQCEQFDYDGKHYNVKLTRLDQQDYPTHGQYSVIDQLGRSENRHDHSNRCERVHSINHHRYHWNRLWKNYYIIGQRHPYQQHNDSTDSFNS